MSITRDEYRRKIIGIFQQSARGDLSSYRDDAGDTIFYHSESGETFLKLTEEQFEKYTANEILDMLGATL